MIAKSPLYGSQNFQTMLRPKPKPSQRSPSSRIGWMQRDDPLDTVPWDQLTHLALFAVDLNADGTVNMRLDCNRAKPVGIKQLPGQLPAGARVAIGGQAVTFENPPDPDRRAE